jgi:hypothetical protein
MKSPKRILFRLRIIPLLLAVFLSHNSHAHEYTNLNEIMIDRVNDSIAGSILQVQSFLTEIFRQSYKPDSWPDTKITVLRNDLMHQKEEANMSLDYFVAKGINVQSQEVLYNNPLAGRSVAASQGIETAFALLKHVNTLESQDEFVKEIYSGGQSAHMYNLLTAYREKMDLYRYIFVTVPGAQQQPGGSGEQSTTDETVTQDNIVPLVIAGLAFFVMITGIVLGKKRLAV